jgi:hypothetical protein
LVGGTRNGTPWFFPLRSVPRTNRLIPATLLALLIGGASGGFAQVWATELEEEQGEFLARPTELGTIFSQRHFQVTAHDRRGDVRRCVITARDTPELKGQR